MGTVEGNVQMLERFQHTAQVTSSSLIRFPDGVNGLYSVHAGNDVSSYPVAVMIAVVWGS